MDKTTVIATEIVIIAIEPTTGTIGIIGGIKCSVFLLFEYLSFLILRFAIILFKKILNLLFNFFKLTSVFLNKKLNKLNYTISIYPT